MLSDNTLKPTKVIVVLISLSGLGVVVGGLTWLTIYHLNYTPDIEFDGPAAGSLILSIFVGWLVFSSGATIYLSQHSSGQTIRKVLRMVIGMTISGLVVGSIVFAILVKYSIQKYGYHPIEGGGCDFSADICVD